MVVQRTKLWLVMPTPYIVVLVRVLAALLLMQLAANVPGEAAGGDSIT